MTITEERPSSIELYARATLRELIDKGTVTHDRIYRSFSIGRTQVYLVVSRVLELGNGAVTSDGIRLVFDPDTPFTDNSRVSAAQQKHRAKKRNEPLT